MNFNSKKTSLLILGATAIVCSRAMFAFFNDPEGPNLLIVMVMAVIIYVLSLPVYVYFPLTKQDGLKRLLFPIFIQIIIVSVFYLFLK